MWIKKDGVNGDYMMGDKDNGEKYDNVNGYKGKNIVKEKR